MDRIGQEILAKLQRSARTSLQNTQKAIALAEQASTQLRAAEDKIARLEQELWSYKERAERAEAWLQRISQDIEQAFPSRQPDNEISGAPLAIPGRQSESDPRLNGGPQTARLQQFLSKINIPPNEGNSLGLLMRRAPADR
jgi:hypothetical protein